MRSSKFLPLAALASAASLFIAACGGDDSSDPAPATGADAPASTDSATVSTDAPVDGQFPVTIDHVYGSTTIDARPERVATVAWANHEVPLALGVVPVGMSKATWGDDDDNGVLPWVEAMGCAAVSLGVAEVELSLIAGPPLYQVGLAGHAGSQAVSPLRLWLGVRVPLFDERVAASAPQRVREDASGDTAGAARRSGAARLSANP